MMTERNNTDQSNPRVTSDPRLGAALESAIARGAEPSTLREAVADYVKRAKAHIVPPQDVIVALKSQLQREALPYLPHAVYSALVSYAVGWAIEEYYRDRP